MIDPSRAAAPVHPGQQSGQWTRINGSVDGCPRYSGDPNEGAEYQMDKEPLSQGQVRWFGFWQEIGSNYVNNASDWQISFQLHGTQSTGSPPVSLEAAGNTVKLRVADAQSDVSSYTQKFRWTGNIDRGVAHYWEIGVNISSNPSVAWVQLYRDGVLVYNSQTTNPGDTKTAYGTGGIYPKQGMYRAAAINGDSTLYFAGTGVFDQRPGVPGAVAQPTVLFQDGFEGTSLGAGGWATYQDASNTNGLDTAVFYSGAKSARFTKLASGYYSYAVHPFTATNDATLTTRIRLDNLTLGSASHTIARLGTGPTANQANSFYEVAIAKTGSGNRWALYPVTGGPPRTYGTPVYSSTAPATGTWQKLTLTSQWNRTGATARLQVSDGTDITSVPVNFSGKQAAVVEAGVIWSGAPSNTLITRLDDLGITNP